MLEREELTLKRFEVTSFKTKSYADVSCTEGSVWITAGKGFSDIVLKQGQHITILSKEMIVVEALSDSSFSVSAKTDEKAPELVMQN